MLGVEGTGVEWIMILYGVRGELGKGCIQLVTGTRRKSGERGRGHSLPDKLHQGGRACAGVYA